MPKIDAGRRFYLVKGPFKTEEEQWEYVLKLAKEMHSELVDIGAIYQAGEEQPEGKLARAVAEFVHHETYER